MKKIINRLLPRLIGAKINLQGIFNPQKAGEQAMLLFCSPRIGRLRDKDKNFLNTADRQSPLSSEYGEVQTYEWNPEGKERVLLLHGWESNAARWRHIIPSLIEADYHVMAIDAPAHGASGSQYFDMMRYADFVRIAADSFNPNQIVGHSIGGATLLYYTTHIRYPQSLKKIAVLGAPSQLKNNVKIFADFLGLSSRVFREMQKYFAKTFGKPMEYFNTADFGNLIRIPALVIHDEEDEIIAFAEGKINGTSIRGAEFIATKGFGHALNNAVVVRRVLNFLEEEVVTV